LGLIVCQGGQKGAEAAAAKGAEREEGEEGQSAEEEGGHDDMGAEVHQVHVAALWPTEYIRRHCEGEEEKVNKEGRHTIDLRVLENV
jgi:hypothetical protein